MTILDPVYVPGTDARLHGRQVVAIKDWEPSCPPPANDSRTACMDKVWAKANRLGDQVSAAAVAAPTAATGRLCSHSRDVLLVQVVGCLAFQACASDQGAGVCNASHVATHAGPACVFHQLHAASDTNVWHASVCSGSSLANIAVAAAAGAAAAVSAVVQARPSVWG